MPELNTLGATIKTTLFAEPDCNNFNDAYKAKLDAVEPQTVLPNELISGNAVWLGGLTFQITDWIARIDGVIYSGSAEAITLSTADPTNPRIDVIVVTAGGSADVVQGTPAADPAKPEVDPLSEVEVTFVLINALATTPADIINDDVYLENTEWTSAEVDSGTFINLADTTDPNTGTTHISFAAAPNGDAVYFQDSIVHSSTEFEALLFAIKNTVANTNQQIRLRIALYNGTDRVSKWIDLRHNSNSYDGSNTFLYQDITIAMAAFNLGTNQFNTVRFEVVANGINTISCYLDDIKFQSGVSVPVPGVTQADIDTAVLNKPQQISFACTAIDGDIEAATTYAAWRPRYDIEVLSVHASFQTAPTGSIAIIDIHAGGTTIMATDKIDIDAGEKDSSTAANPPVLTTTLIDANTEVLIIVDQKGSTIAGAGLVVDMVYRQR